MRFGPHPLSNCNTFRQRRFNFFLVGGHFISLFEADHFDVLGAKPQSGSGNINRDITAADNEDFALHRRLFGRSRLSEKFNAVQNTVDLSRLRRRACGSYEHRRR